MPGLGKARQGKVFQQEAKMATALKRKQESAVVHLTEVSNDAADTITTSAPYVARVTIVGDADILFHRWSCDAVEAKAKAAKNSAAKKTDNLETYVYRTPDGYIGLPGEYLRGALIAAAKFRQDPRSTRKSAQDLAKAALVSLTDVASLGVGAWDYEHRARVTVQRAGITRVRPALRAGWRASVQIMVTLPEYIDQSFLRGLLADAGRLIGVGDFRPTYGRFSLVGFEV